MEIAIAIFVALFLIGFIIAFVSSIPAGFCLSAFWGYVFIGACCVCVYSMGIIAILKIIKALFICVI